MPQCFKIVQKVAFNIAREASYVYILSGQKFIKNAKNSQFSELWKIEACGQTVLLDRSFLIGQTLVENDKTEKFKWDIFVWFSTFFANIVKVVFHALKIELILIFF